MDRRSLIKTIFYERSLRKENVYKLNYLSITTIILGIVSILSLLYIFLFGNNSLSVCCRLEEKRLPLVLTDFAAIQTLLHRTTINCRAWKVINCTPAAEDENIEGRWRLGTSLCLDQFPSRPNPSNCRIYSTSYDSEDVNFEMEMGENGCRVHFWGNKTKLNYGKLFENGYFYPLDIAPSSSKDAVYSYDDFLDLLGHNHLPIHLLKSNLPGGEWKLLKSLVASKTEAWKRVKQIRLLVYLPRVTTTSWQLLEVPYRHLAALANLGFKLAKFRRDPRYEYSLSDFQDPMSTLYELIYIR